MLTFFSRNIVLIASCLSLTACDNLFDNDPILSYAHCVEETKESLGKNAKYICFKKYSEEGKKLDFSYKSRPLSRVESLTNNRWGIGLQVLNRSDSLILVESVKLPIVRTDGRPNRDVKLMCKPSIIPPRQESKVLCFGEPVKISQGEEKSGNWTIERYLSMSAK